MPPRYVAYRTNFFTKLNSDTSGRPEALHISGGCSQHIVSSYF